MSIIEKIIMEKTLLGGGKVSYPARKAYRPPFTPEFIRDILPMVKTHPQFFTVTYARGEDPPGDDAETKRLADMQAEADRLNAGEDADKGSQKGKK